LTYWLSVVGPLHKTVIYSFIIPVAPIIKWTWHEVHLHNHFLKFSYTQQFVLLYLISSTNNKKFHNLLCVLPYFSSFSYISWVSSISENWNIFFNEHSFRTLCCFDISHKVNIFLYFLNQCHCFLFVICFHVEHCCFYNVSTPLFGLFDF
jgi:hypothetical protein